MSPANQVSNIHAIAITAVVLSIGCDAFIVEDALAPPPTTR